MTGSHKLILGFAAVALVVAAGWPIASCELANVELHDDRLVSRGVAKLHGAALSSFNDHRILMSRAVAASAARCGRS